MSVRLRWTAAAGVLLLAGIGLLLPGPVGATSGKKKCSSFASQKAAQSYFTRHGGSQADDVAGLDPDGDGLVCPENPGPFAAYVELGFAHGFFYGQVVCVDYPAHLTKAEVRAEEKSAEEAAKAKSKYRGSNCVSPLIEVKLMQAAPGEDPVVASHKAEAGGEPEILPLGAPAGKATGSVVSFEFKLTPKKTKGTFYASSEECFGTASRKVRGG